MKTAVVRVYSPSGAFFGTGCLTIRGLIVTCAHVVRDALAVAQVTGAEPKGRLKIDCPFLPGQPSFMAEVAKGGWGWINQAEPVDDIAILRLIGPSPSDDVPSFSPADLPSGNEEVIAHGFTDAHQREGGEVTGRLGSDALRPSGTYLFDTKDSTHIASPGFSGAPVFVANMACHIGIPRGMISSKPLVDEKDEHRLVRNNHRIAYVVPAHRIRELIDRVREAEDVAASGPAELRLALSLIPAARSCLKNVKPINSAQQFEQGVSTILEHFAELEQQPLDEPALKRMVRLIGNLEGHLRKAGELGFDDKSRLLSVQDFCGELTRFGERLRECHPDEAAKSEIPNDWGQNDKLPHADELKLLRQAIRDRQAMLADREVVDPEVRRLARYALQELEEALDGDPLSLRVIDEVRQQLEQLDRSVFKELIIASQLLLSHYAARLPDKAVFRDFREGPEMVVIPAGTILMGSPEEEEGRENSEGPQHRVTIPRRFALGRYPVTVREYLHAVGKGVNAGEILQRLAGAKVQH